MLQIFYLLYLGAFWIPTYGFSLVPAFKGKSDMISGNTVVSTVEPDYLTATDLAIHPTVKNTFEIASIFANAPSCELIASAALAYSCSSIDISHGNLIDHVKTVHAARLAICELHAAQVEIPRQCTTFIPRPDSYKKIETRGFLKDGRLANTNLLYPKYDAETEAHTQECTAALHKTPQYWTSFSNNKQTGIDICQAVQSGAQADNLAKMFQETVTIFTEMIKEQQDITAEFMLATDLLKDHQEALATNHSEMIQTSRDALNSIISQIVGTHTDLSREVDTTRDSLAALYANIDNMAELIPGIFSATDDLMNAVDSVDGSLKKAASSAQNLDTSITNSTTMVDRMNNDLTSMQAHIDEAKSFFRWIISIKDSMPSTEKIIKNGRTILYLCYMVAVNVGVGFIFFHALRIEANCSRSACYASALAITIVTAGIVSITGQFLIAIQDVFSPLVFCLSVFAFSSASSLTVALISCLVFRLVCKEPIIKV